ncbi:MAG: DUF1080 domain-containing protein [Betaproteobacteria bacterium]
MKRMLCVALASLAVAGCAQMGGGSAAGGKSGGEGWITLFDGTSLENFDRVGDANWRIEDGNATADKGNGFLLTKKEFKDFQIRAEFYAESDTNSGVFLRCSNRKTISAAECYEVNIWDTRPGQEYATGGIVDTAKVSPVPKAGGRWNTYEITAKGDHLVVMLNGQKTAETHNGKHASGPIGLQRAPGNNKEAPTPIKWRRVEIKPL